MSFSKSKLMKLPRNISIGHQVIEDTADFCEDLNLFGTSLIITGPNTRKIAGEKIASILNEKNYDVEIVEVHEPTYEEVEKSKQKAKEIDPNFLIGAGGGKAIDISKVGSAELNLPFISFPTATSHDGIASGRASIRNDEQDKVSIKSQPPQGIICDTSILVDAPWRLTASGCADIVSNYTAVKDWELARKLRNAEYSSYASALSKMTAETLVENGDSIKEGLEESTWIVAKGLISSGVAMSIAGSSRPASGSEHKFSHMLDRVAPEPALHGEQCGVGTIMMMYLHGGDWEGIRNVLNKIGAPVNAESLGIEDKYIIEALIRAHEIRPERYTILGNSGLTREAAEKLAKKTKVIK